ncbi:putative eka-like protein [Ceratocystis lukuohia]|uniref:Eka-like protein n=1 Tax=Ceratocystis lukuohia TaxID=2019550 RepID=A0ABR4MR07_9PEZI
MADRESQPREAEKPQETPTPDLPPSPPNVTTTQAKDKDETTINKETPTGQATPKEPSPPKEGTNPSEIAAKPPPGKPTQESTTKASVTGAFADILNKTLEEEKKKMEDTARGIRALTNQLDGLTAAEDLDGVGKAGQQAYKDILRRVMTVIEEEIRHKLTGTRGNTPTANTTPKPTTAQKRAPQTWAEKAAAGKATQAAKPKGTAQKAQANVPPALPETPKTSHRKVDENRLLATLFEDSDWKMVNPAVVKQRINRDLFKGEEVILRMTSTRTGFAFHAKEGKMDTEAKELIRNFLKAKTVGKETVWVKFVIPNVPKTINTIEEGKLVTRPTSMDDVKSDIQMAFGGDIKLMDWREYEHDPTMRGLRVAIHEPKEVPKTIEILGLSRIVRQSSAKA